MVVIRQDCLTKTSHWTGGCNFYINWQAKPSFRQYIQITDLILIKQIYQFLICMYKWLSWKLHHTLQSSEEDSTPTLPNFYHVFQILSIMVQKLPIWGIRLLYLCLTCTQNLLLHCPLSFYIHSLTLTIRAFQNPYSYWGGTLGSDVTLNLSWSLSMFDAGLRMSVPE